MNKNQVPECRAEILCLLGIPLIGYMQQLYPERSGLGIYGLFFLLVAALKIRADVLRRLRFLPCYKRKYLRPNSHKPLRSGYIPRITNVRDNMKYLEAVLPDDLAEIKKTAEAAFLSTTDSALDQWFSFSVMEEKIKQRQGICIKAVDEQETIVGMIYAQQENPINGAEGIEKWVIIIAAVLPEFTAKGIGSQLLKTIEQHARACHAKKLFVFTNKDDSQVIRFYKKNGFEDAGWIKDYQYGKNNSAVFLIKYLQNFG